MQISSPFVFGKSGGAPSPERGVKSDGMSTRVRKLRFRQSLPGRRPTRVEEFSALPFALAGRTTSARRFLENGIGTRRQAYKVAPVKQSFCAAEKGELREKMRARLRALSSAERARRSQEICARVLARPEWVAARSVLLFRSLASEPDVSALATAAHAAGKEVRELPVTPDAELLGVLESSAPDVVIVPGLAFTRAGDRLGRGGGFFDWLLAGSGRRAYKLGVCFAFQMLAELPLEPHDVPVDTVIADETL